MQQVLDALKYMGIGMLGIFLVMAVIFLFVLILNNWRHICAWGKRALASPEEQKRIDAKKAEASGENDNGNRPE